MRDLVGLEHLIVGPESRDQVRPPRRRHLSGKMATTMVESELDGRPLGGRTMVCSAKFRCSNTGWRYGSVAEE